MKRFVYILLLPSFACAQDPAMHDAQDQYEAAAMLHTKVHVAEAMGVACSSRFPELSQGIKSELKKWKSADAKAIGRAEALWQDMEYQSPQPEREKPDYPAQAKRMLEGTPEAKAREYCSQHFQKLASGLWRRAAPNMYRLLEPQ